MTLKVKVNEIYFQYQPKVSQDAYLGANSVIPAQICEGLLRGQAEFPRILSQNDKNDPEDQSQ